MEHFNREHSRPGPKLPSQEFKRPLVLDSWHNFYKNTDNIKRTLVKLRKTYLGYGVDINVRYPGIEDDRIKFCFDVILSRQCPFVGVFWAIACTPLYKPSFVFVNHTEISLRLPTLLVPNKH